ncbi:MAG: MFS transporter, partial [Legionellales bacterium]|nr:MFS transporter [Legionellales bacterium]
FDRRIILITLCISIALSSLLMLVFSYFSTKMFFIFCVIFGGIVFMLYPLSISHTCDYVNHEDIVGATQGLLLSYGLGATIGPIFSALFMHISYIGLFIFISFLSSLLGVFIYKRKNVTTDLPLDEQHSFTISSTTTPVASNMDPRANEIEEV